MFKKISLFFKYQPTIARLTLENELEKLLPSLGGEYILEIGAGIGNSHSLLIPHSAYVTMDICSKATPDIIGDAFSLPFRDAIFDRIIMTEVLEHCYEPKEVIKECYRVIKNGGVLILSTRFVYPIHDAPSDYYRFTENCLERLLADFSSVKITPLGHRFGVIMDLISGDIMLLRILTRFTAYILPRNKICPCGWLVQAVK